jgi:hypothetical protein
VTSALYYVVYSRLRYLLGTTIEYVNLRMKCSNSKNGSQFLKINNFLEIKEAFFFHLN